MSIEDCGSAFLSIGVDPRDNTGMTLRDYFAAQALRGFISDELRTPTAKGVAESCYELADAMLKAKDD